MASSASSSSSATTGSISSSSITHGVNPSLLLLSNMAGMATVKLDYNNYIVWRHQIEVILVAYSMINFIEYDPLLANMLSNNPCERPSAT